jgi:hypothetical protein
MKRLICLAAVALASTGAALAEEQYYTTIEDAGLIREEHLWKLESDSVTRQADMVRFDVKAGWKTPQSRPATEAPGRVLRYLARCESKELALMAVAVLDNNRRVVKTFGIAPGGWDWSLPEKGTAEAELLDKACSVRLL